MMKSMMKVTIMITKGKARVTETSMKCRTEQFQRPSKSDQKFTAISRTEEKILGFVTHCSLYFHSIHPFFLLLILFEDRFRLFISFILLGGKEYRNRRKSGIARTHAGSGPTCTRAGTRCPRGRKLTKSFPVTREGRSCHREPRRGSDQVAFNNL